MTLSSSSMPAQCALSMSSSGQNASHVYGESTEVMVPQS